MALFWIGNAEFGHGPADADLMGLLPFVTILVVGAGRYYGLDGIIERTALVKRHPKLRYPAVTTMPTAAMALCGGLMTLGTVVLGLVGILAGKPFGAAPLTNEAGAIVTMPAVDPTPRTGLVLAVLGLYAAATAEETVDEQVAAETTAD